MQKRFAFYYLLALLLLMLAFNRQVMAQQSEPATQLPDPEAVVRAEYDAMNAGDLDATMAVVADYAVNVALPPPPGSNGVFIGKDAIYQLTSELIGRNFHVDLTDLHVNGDRVSFIAVLDEDVFRGFGVSPLEFSVTIIVQNGQVISELWVMTSQSQARFDAAIALSEKKTVVRRFYDELWNQGDMAVADEIIASDFADGYTGQNGIEALKETVQLFRTAFPDMVITYDDLIAEGDLVAATVTFNMGAYQGGLSEIMGIPDSAIGTEVVLRGVDYARVVDGKMVAGWGTHDDLAWLQQFGLELTPSAQ